MESLQAKVAAATAGRDRVADLAKVAALLMVIVGHSIAWQVHDGRAINVLEIRPQLIWLTWVVQILPIFFAMGAMANEHSLTTARASVAALGGSPGAGNREFWTRRLTRLLGPVLVYATLWTVLLTAAGIFSPGIAHDAGVFLAQLLWFVGVYLVVTAAVPATLALHRSHPAATLVVWFGVIVAVDVARTQGQATLGWVNIVLVWAWLHQWGYLYPRLRVAPRSWTLLAAVVLFAAAVALSQFGPYQNSMVSVAGDEGLSNLSPPSVVLALEGLAMVLLLAAADRTLARLMANARAWAGVAALGSRGMGLYLWHIPVVGLVAGTALALGWEITPLTPMWYLAHSLTALAAVVGAFTLAGMAGGAERKLPRSMFGDHAGPAAILLSAVLVLHLSVTGFRTWWGPGALGLPGSSLINLAALWALWLGRGRSTRGS